MIVGQQAGAQGVVGFLLEAGVEAGMHNKAAFGGRVLAKALEKLAADVFGEPFGAGDKVRAAVGVRDQRLGVRGVGLILGDGVGFDHAVDDPVAAVAGGVGSVERVVVAGGFGQRAEHGGLADGELVKRFVEIGLCGGGDAEGALPEVDLVQVELEDALFGQGVLDAQG